MSIILALLYILSNPVTQTPQPPSLSHRNLPRRNPTHNNHPILRQYPRNSIIPPLPPLLPIRIPMRINHTINTPRSTQHSRCARVLQARDEHRGEPDGDVLVEVLVPALRAVEGVESLLALGRGRLHLLVGGVFVGVGELCGASEGADAEAEVGADEEGGDGGEEDVAEGC
jgi:hypothetical protein